MKKRRNNGVLKRHPKRKWRDSEQYWKGDLGEARVGSKGVAAKPAQVDRSYPAAMLNPAPAKTDVPVRTTPVF